jgi:hypothetical protein
VSSFFRFPRTPHLAWLGPGQGPADDKVLSAAEMSSLLDHELVVEEKVDGANLGFSTSDEGELLVQNRGSYLDRRESHPQFRPLWPWLSSRSRDLGEALWPHLMLFGEWCYAVHSVAYARLPSYFLGFDVYDREMGKFWDTSRRDAFLAQLGLDPVPRLAQGRFSKADLVRLIAAPSRVGAERMEGIVVRHEAEGFTDLRAKLVRAEFTQAIGEHWSRQALRRNRLASFDETSLGTHAQSGTI